MDCPPGKKQNEKMTNRRREVVVEEKGLRMFAFGCARYWCRVSMGLTDSCKTFV